MNARGVARADYNIKSTRYGREGHCSPSQTDLQELFETKYRMPYGLGWGPRLRREFGYCLPDDYYEALVAKLVTGGCSWADVGCGRDIFPSNRKLAGNLAKRAQDIFGIDPDDNIGENPFLTERFQGLVEDCPTEKRFHVITMRMVAEHIRDPKRAVQRLATLTEKNGLVIVFTPNRWSPMSLLAKMIPFMMHNPLKRLILGFRRKRYVPRRLQAEYSPRSERVLPRAWI